MKNLKEAFGARVKELRKMRGFTQEELAEMIDLNPRQLARLEKGENFSSAETLAKLAVGLDITLSDLFDFEWNQEVTLLATGTDAVPMIRLVQKDEKVKIHGPQDKIKEMDVPKQMDAAVTESVMKNTAIRLRKQLTVEYFNDKTRKYIKTFYPDGRVEVNISEKSIESEEIQNYIKDKMKKYSSQAEKLEFLKIAVDAISDPQALKELKLLLKGIELAQSNHK